MLMTPNTFNAAATTMQALTTLVGVYAAYRRATIDVHISLPPRPAKGDRRRADHRKRGAK